MQTFGNESIRLKSDHGDLLEVNYLSDGKTLEATLWLGSDPENASIYDQPFKKISYGILIKIASYNINTGFSGQITIIILNWLTENGMNIFINYPQLAVKCFYIPKQIILNSLVVLL